MNKPKVLLTASTFPRWKNDQISSFVFYLAKGLLEHYDVYVLAPHFKGAKTFEVMEGVKVYRFRYFLEKYELLTYGGGAVNNLNKSPFIKLLIPFYLPSNFYYLLRLNLKHKFYVVNVHWILPTGLLALLIKPFFKFKLVISSHGGDVYGITKSLIGKVLNLQKLNAFITNRANAVIPVSSSIKGMIASFSAKDKLIEICPMGIDYSKFFNSNPLRNFKEIKLLFVGRLAQEKGLNYLMEAAKLLAESKCDFSLDIAGAGPLEGYVREFITENKLENKVRLLGYINNTEVPELLKNYNIFISTSLREGLPVAYMEAMAAGLVCVVSNTNGINDLIESGKDGIIYEIGNVKALVDSIKNIAANKELYNSISKAAQTKAKEFDWVIITNKYNEIFKKA